MFLFAFLEGIDMYQGELARNNHDSPTGGRILLPRIKSGSLRKEEGKKAGWWVSRWQCLPWVPTPE